MGHAADGHRLETSAVGRPVVRKVPAERIARIELQDGNPHQLGGERTKRGELPVRQEQPFLVQHVRLEVHPPPAEMPNDGECAERIRKVVENAEEQDQVKRSVLFGGQLVEVGLNV